MMSSKTDKHGRKIADRGNKALSTEAVKLLKTQDAGYLRTMGQKTRRAREKVEMEYVLGDGMGKINIAGRESRKTGEKLVFVGSKEEQREYAAEGRRAEPGKGGLEDRDTEDMTMDDQEEAEDGAGNPPPLQPQQSKALLEAQEAALRKQRASRKQHKRDQETRRSKLEALKTRERDLFAAERELDVQRAKMSSSIGGVTKAGLKWKVGERKR
jgi:U3 small nucleolar RNA-associated protein 11